MGVRKSTMVALALLSFSLGACATATPVSADLGDACVFSGPLPVKPKRTAESVHIGTMTLNGREIDVYRRPASLIPNRTDARRCGSPEIG